MVFVITGSYVRVGSLDHNKRRPRQALQLFCLHRKFFAESANGVNLDALQQEQMLQAYAKDFKLKMQRFLSARFRDHQHSHKTL